MADQTIATRCVQGGYTPGDGEPRQIPIVQSTTFKYATSEHMGQLFDLEASGYFYTRLQNPTNDAVAAKICELEGGAAAIRVLLSQTAYIRIPHSQISQFQATPHKSTPLDLHPVQTHRPHQPIQQEHGGLLYPQVLIPLLSA